MLLNQERNQIDAALYKSCRFSSRFILLNAAAPVKSYHEELGEISSYPPGYKENVDIFCHNNPWVSCAETVVGHGDRALEIYQKTGPAYIEDSQNHRLSRWLE